MGGSLFFFGENASDPMAAESLHSSRFMVLCIKTGR